MKQSEIFWTWMNEDRDTKLFLEANFFINTEIFVLSRIPACHAKFRPLWPVLPLFHDEKPCHKELCTESFTWSVWEDFLGEWHKLTELPFQNENFPPRLKKIHQKIVSDKSQTDTSVASFVQQKIDSLQGFDKVLLSRNVSSCKQDARKYFFRKILARFAFLVN